MKKNGAFSKAYIFIILLITYLPITLVILYSFNESRINSIWTEFTFRWYRELFQDRDLMIALKNSLVLATITSLLSGFIGALGAIGLSKLQFRGKEALTYLSSIPILTPEIIIGILLLSFFSLLRFPFGMLTLIISHTLFCIPYVFMMVKARLVGIDPSYVEAALDLGASNTRAFFDITLPAIMPGLLSGMLLAFVMSMDDVVISIFVNGSKSNTLPIKIYTQLKTSVSPKINALCTLMFFGTIIVVVVSNYIGKKDLIIKK